MAFPGIGVSVSNGPPQLGIQFIGGYWPGMDLDEFEAAYNEVAEPLYIWVSGNWMGSFATSRGLEQLKEGVRIWLEGNVPREIRHPVVGAEVLWDSNHPQTVTISLEVAAAYLQLHKRLMDRGLPPMPEIVGLPSLPPRPPKKPERPPKKPESDGWDEDPLEL